jgi:hypothetical protein
VNRAADWMSANLAMQGYCLAEPERRALRVGLRLSTGVCLVLTALALMAGSPLAFLVLAAIGAVAGFSARHPFDQLWNAGVRHLFRAPPLPPSPARRRHAFKVAGAMMLVVAVLFASGAELAATIVGLALLAACTTVTATNLCIPSLALSLIERRRRREALPT